MNPERRLLLEFMVGGGISAGLVVLLGPGIRPSIERGKIDFIWPSDFRWISDDGPDPDPTVEEAISKILPTSTFQPVDTVTPQFKPQETPRATATKTIVVPSPTPTVEVETINEISNIKWIPETVTRHAEDIKELAKKHKIPETLGAGLVLTESAGNEFAVSKSGALGLCQVMPFNAGTRNLLDKRQNLDAGMEYLAKMYKQFGNWDHAIMAYFAGPGNVSSWIKSGATPSSMAQYYLSLVGGFWKEAGLSKSPTFDKWIANGANGFIDRARKLYSLDTRVFNALEFATQQMGCHYKLKTEGPQPDGSCKWDCARLVYFSYLHGGIDFNKYPGIGGLGKIVDGPRLHVGRTLSKTEEKLPGDLVIFDLPQPKFTYDHIGMMLYPPYVYIESTALEDGTRISALSSSYKCYRADTTPYASIKRVIELQRSSFSPLLGIILGTLAASKIPELRKLAYSYLSQGV